MSQKAIASKTPTTWREIIPAVAALIFVIAVFWWVIRFLQTASWRSILGYAITLAVIFLLAFLKIRFKAADRAIDTIFWAYFLFLGWVLAALGPVLLFYWLSPLTLDTSRVWLQVIVFVVWGLLLAAGLLLVATEKNRELYLLPLRNFSRFAPIAYSFNLLMIAILFFSSVTYVLVDHGVMKLNSPTAAKISPEAIRDFYSWHFLQALPLLKVNETIHWKEPLTYDGGLIGFLLLLFELTVILPVIAAFGWRWKKSERRRQSARRRIPVQPYM